MTNQVLGLRPRRLASRDVMIGILNKNKAPKLKNIIAPILFSTKSLFKISQKNKI